MMKLPKKIPNRIRAEEDIRSLTDQQLIEAILDNKVLPYYLEPYNMFSSNRGFSINRQAEDAAFEVDNRFSSLLSKELESQHNLKPEQSLQYRSDAIAERMGAPKTKTVLSLEGPTGWYDPTKNIIGISPETEDVNELYSTLAHELRHSKEYSIDPERADKLTKFMWNDDIPNSVPGRLLSNFGEGRYKKTYIDALKEYKAQEAGHFLSDFLHENTKRVLKKLPLVGVGASMLLGEDADAAILGEVIPGGVEQSGISDERAIDDPRYQEYIKKHSRRK